MSKHLTFWSCVVLVCAGFSACVPPPSTDPRPFGTTPLGSNPNTYDPEEDFAVLRSYDQSSHDAPRRVIESARRVFDKVRLDGRTREQLVLRLGEPLQVLGINGILYWDYAFDDNGDGVFRRLEFYTADGEVRVLTVHSPDLE